ncbi:hypothetical protein DY000_02031774 [Brassica cretica]|uniref:Uncharacterized protein n=1 Tax=Brassica cretica TaxID=69181 RepID=A0ABQ7DSB1_BRACR|nr:hypothetical protein DY000_02031774 [Brassica cretica]
MTSLHQVAPLLESCRREVELGAGVSPRCKRSRCLRFIWSGCRKIYDLSAGATETPETVREGYCGANLSLFHSGGLIFPVLEPILEILAELGLSLTHILPNFLRYLIAILVRAREVGLSFGLGEFRQLVLVKQNQQNPGTFLVSPCPGRHFIGD